MGTTPSTLRVSYIVQVTGVTHLLVYRFILAQLNAHLDLYICLTLIDRYCHLGTLFNAARQLYSAVCTSFTRPPSCNCIRLQHIIYLILNFSLPRTSLSGLPNAFRPNVQSYYFYTPTCNLICIRSSNHSLILFLYGVNFVSWVIYLIK